LDCHVKIPGNIVDEDTFSGEGKGVRVGPNLFKKVFDVAKGDAFGLKRDRVEDARIAHLV